MGPPFCRRVSPGPSLPCASRSSSREIRRIQRGKVNQTCLILLVLNNGPVVTGRDAGPATNAPAPVDVELPGDWKSGLIRRGMDRVPQASRDALHSLLASICNDAVPAHSANSLRQTWSVPDSRTSTLRCHVESRPSALIASGCAHAALLLQDPCQTPGRASRKSHVIEITGNFCQLRALPATKRDAHHSRVRLPTPNMSGNVSARVTEL